MRLDVEKRRFYLGRDYSEALEHFGASPVMLPLIAKREYITEIVKNLDGILLPGSDTDVDPNRFGEDPHPRLKNVITEKDETDLLLLEEVEKLNLPVLAICFGMQILNVFRGGTLFQDIEAQIQNCIKHEQGIPLERNSHQISFSEQKSLLCSFVPEKKLKDVKVNSHHHQAINLLGKDLKAVAFSADGVVECIEDKRENRFVLAVQWHPELSYKTDFLSKRIFEGFVKFCANNRRIDR
ncbi:MAG TPA: gamma-glutamyl-gamma-aminobutyrate hydrolase family protein [Pyrinomonadaceae bacterium]